MNKNPAKYPEGSVLSQLMMDIYAHSGKITILYDRTFTQELLGLEYDAKNAELYFHFTPGRLPFGEPLIDEIGQVMASVESATLLQVDLDANETVMGLEVPVKQLT